MRVSELCRNVKGVVDVHTSEENGRRLVRCAVITQIQVRAVVDEIIRARVPEQRPGPFRDILHDDYNEASFRPRRSTR